MVKVRIVPDAEPNADSVLHCIDEIDAYPATGRWSDVERLVAPFIPKGWHVVGTANIEDQI